MTNLEKNFKKIFYYKRDENKTCIDILHKKSLKVGDTIEFFGHLFSDKQYKNLIATSKICYTIESIGKDNFKVCNVIANFKFSEGDITLSGNILTKNLDIIDGKILPYKTIPALLSLISSSKKIKGSYGTCKYIIKGNGYGTIKFNINILH
jgi:hypothetical protein